MTTTDCTIIHTLYCDNTLRSGPSYGPYGTEGHNATQSDFAEPSTSFPGCQVILNPMVKSYCSSHRPVGTELTNIQAALNTIDSFCGVCSTMAALGREMLRDTMRIRVFPDSIAPTILGAAPLNGANEDPEHNKWLTLNDYMVLLHADAAHATKAPADLYAPRTLAQVLAHELDHLMNYDHTDAAGTKTTHSQICSGLPA